MKLRFVALLALFALGACSDNNDPSPNNIQFEGDQGNNGNNTTTGDMGTTPTDTGGDPVDMGSQDTGMELDFAVAAEGFMHGTWLVERASGGEIATLRLRHEAGETNVEGTFTMTEPAAFGTLGGTNWIDNEFTTSWTVVVDGLDERFGLAMCAPSGGDDTLGCRYSDPLAGDITDATMTRQ